MVLVVIVVASGFGIHKNAFSLCSQIVHLNKFRKNEGLWKDTELLWKSTLDSILLTKEQSQPECKGENKT